MLQLLHLCDSLFPLGAFAYSDGLEAAATIGPRAHSRNDRAAATDERASIELLRAWLDVLLDETIGHLEGRGVSRAWTALSDADWPALIALDAELTALRPSSSGRRSSRTMGLRLLTTWQALHPHPSAERALMLARDAAIGPTLPVAFAGACVSVGIHRRAAVEGYAYTRLAAAISAAMRLMPIGQTAAHAALARVLARVPAMAGAVMDRDAPLESFTPMVDIAAMSQQYLHSRMFRS